MLQSNQACLDTAIRRSDHRAWQSFIVPLNLLQDVHSGQLTGTCGLSCS